MERNALGKHLVADPKICHGKPTFAGTRIMVWQVFEELADEVPWEDVVKNWDGKVSKEAIAEALMLARHVFEEHKSLFLLDWQRV